MTPTALLSSCVLHLPSQCQPPKVQGWLLALPAALSTHALFLRKSQRYSMHWGLLSVKTAVHFTAPPSPCCPQAGGSAPPGPVLLHFAPLCVTIPSPPSVRLTPSPHCLNLKPQFSCLDFVAIHIQTSAPFKSFNLQQFPPEGWEVQFLCRYLCPSRRFQELQLSLTSVQCSIKWTVYGNKFKMFTILYILYI